MTFTSDERREVAERLRAAREFISGLPKASLGQNAFDVFERILSCVGYERGNIFDYLSDLIDRPTCKNSEDLYDGSFFECSECGERWELTCGSPADNNLNFCPRCGAEVVE